MTPFPFSPQHKETMKSFFTLKEWYLIDSAIHSDSRINPNVLDSIDDKIFELFGGLHCQGMDD
tara:strand:- start:286 stop:474 length:189 start_codon:yes stop_codon:yes gene_type:complete